MRQVTFNCYVLTDECVRYSSKIDTCFNPFFVNFSFIIHSQSFTFFLGFEEKLSPSSHLWIHACRSTVLFAMVLVLLLLFECKIADC